MAGWQRVRSVFVGPGLQGLRSSVHVPYRAPNKALGLLKLRAFGPKAILYKAFGLA